MSIYYKGYVTDDPDKAEALYRDKTGLEPSVLLVRPNFVTKSKNKKIVRSRFGAAGMILVTHDPEALADLRRRDETGIPYWPADGSNGAGNGAPLDEIDVQLSKPIIPKRKPGRPAAKKATCPNCGEIITDFERIGFWYGWALGIEPPYWEALREYVFERDKHTCQNCGNKFAASGLRAHHIIRKEDGGEDGARNLTTLCADCHPDEHPIYPTEEL